MESTDIPSDGIVGRPVKLNKWFTSSPEKKLIPIGDLHLGTPGADVQKFTDTLRYCGESDAWILLMGDLFEAATRNSVGAGVYEQVITPQDQLDQLEALLSPYKELIIGAHMGNHEFRILKDVGVNMVKVLCKTLSVPYLGYSSNHALKVGKQRYIVFSCHGASGATLPHTKIRAVLDIARWNVSDLYLMGHVHTLDTKTMEYREYDSKKKIMAEKKRYFALTGHFCGWDGSYADMKGYAPEKTGVVKIKLFGSRHDIHLTI